ncbi:membrane bound O-acyl transferase family-domain-containing protein [Aspergillus multicolor]|uniref:wax synthase family protein n=1 Tax=Aspergillus multicolor TaxID=41759 RepID=UPI003CCE4FE6
MVSPPPIPPWAVPVTAWTLLQSLTGLTATLTLASSPLRYLAAATTALIAYIFQTSMQTHFAGTRPSGPLVAMCWVNVLNAFDLLLFTRASYDGLVAYLRTKDEKKHDNTRKQTPESDSLRAKTVFAIMLPYNYRRIGTPWQISRLPIFTFPSIPTSRLYFYLYSIAELTIAMALINALTLPPDNTNLLLALKKLNTSKSVLLLPLRVLTGQSPFYYLWLQARFTLSFGIITRAAISASYTAGALVAVSLGAKPAEWPPIAGSLGQAWTLQRLWGYSWHQTLRRPLSATATFLSSLLGFKPTSPGAHWIRVIFAFVGSGIVHAACDMGFGIPFERSGGVAYFSLQILGLVLESVFQNMIARFGLSANGLFARVVGYIWVCAFLLWSTPVWINPILVNIVKDGVNGMSPWLGFRPGSF